MRLRVTEIDEDAVAHILTTKPPNRLGNTLLVARDDLTQILGVHARGERRRTDEVREHHGNLAALRGIFWGDVD